MILGPILDHRHHFDECCSTNERLWNIIDSIDNHEEHQGAYATTDFQEAGRGQGNNHWYSSHGQNILISIYITPLQIPPVFQFDISRIASLLQLCFLSEFISSEKLRIKWPNDMYVNDRKLSGMLIENRVLGNSIRASVIGIGINVNELDFPDTLPNATSLAQLTGKEYDLEQLLKQMVKVFRKRYRGIKSYQPQVIHKEYDKWLYGLGEKRSFMANGKHFDGVILGTDRAGLLHIQSNGSNRFFGMKEVVYL